MFEQAKKDISQTPLDIHTLLYCIKSSIVLNVNHMEHYVNVTERGSQ